MKLYTESFCDFDLFKYDYVEDDECMLLYSGVEWLLNSMKHFNGKSICRIFDGSFIIYDEEGKEVKLKLFDIPEVREYCMFYDAKEISKEFIDEP